MYAEAHFSTSRGIVRPQGPISRCFRFFYGLNIIMEAPGQLRGVRVSI